MDKKTSIIIYKGTEYEVRTTVLLELEKMGMQINDSYVEKILQNQSPFSNWSLSYLINIDLNNIKYIGSNSILGRIIKLDKKGDVLDYFETVYDATINGLKGNYTYSFENLHKNGYVPKKQRCIFFGLSISYNYNHPIIKKLNRRIRHSQNWYYGKNKNVIELFTSEIASRMSFEEYLLQKIKFDSFCFVEEIRLGGYLNNDNFDIVPMKKSKYTSHDISSCEDYENRLVKLLSRYSYKEKTLFEKVEDLSQYRKRKGIYILCLTQLKGCYVGQTRKCLATRISQHFTSENSEFDKNYRPSDVKQIYVLPVDETMDLVESDCIAMLGKDICVNALAGGKSIELIKSDTYKAENYLLSDDILKWAITDSINFSEYERDVLENS